MCVLLLLRLAICNCMGCWCECVTGNGRQCKMYYLAYRVICHVCGACSCSSLSRTTSSLEHVWTKLAFINYYSFISCQQVLVYHKEAYDLKPGRQSTKQRMVWSCSRSRFCRSRFQRFPVAQNYTYKCVDCSRHNGIKGATTKCVP